MVLKLFFDISTSFRFSKDQCECTLHSEAPPWSNQLWLLVLRNNYSKIARTDLIQTLQSYKKLVFTPSVFLCVSVSIQHLVRAKLSSPTAKGGKESISWVIILSSSDETKDVFRYGRKTQLCLLQLKEDIITLIILHKLEDKYTKSVLLESFTSPYWVVIS